MPKLYLNTKRNGYDVGQCGPTMTVGELMNLLEDFDPETKLYLKNDGGYTYGSIRESDFEEIDESE